jgi:nucleoid DNA-binding protein
MKTNVGRINRMGLIRAVASKTNLSQEKVSDVVDQLLDEIKGHFHQRNMIELRGFGTFYPHFKKARTYKISRLKEEVSTKGRLTLKFKPSRSILLYE